MEKLVLGNGIEVLYDRIRKEENQGKNYLIFGANGGNLNEIEEKLADQGALERITQVDQEGNVQAEHKNYDIFTKISKIKGAEGDVIEVVLEQEEEWRVALRRMQQVYDGAIADLGAVTSTLAEQAEGGTQ